MFVKTLPCFEHLYALILSKHKGKRRVQRAYACKLLRAAKPLPFVSCARVYQHACVRTTVRTIYTFYKLIWHKVFHVPFCLYNEDIIDSP